MKTPWLPIIALIIITAAFGLIGGTPHAHPDFVTRNSFQVMARYGNPDFFNYPALVIYCAAFIYTAIYAILKGLGIAESPAYFTEALDAGYLIQSPVKIPFHLPGHLLIILFSLIGVLSVFYITKFFTRKTIFAFSGALLVAISPLWMSDSHMVTVDVPSGAMVFFCIAVVVWLEERKLQGQKRLIALGTAVGIATSAKYPMAVVLIPIWLYLFFENNSLREKIKQSVFVGAYSFLVFLLINPFVIIDFFHFLEDFLFEWEHSKVGHFGNSSTGFWYHFFVSMRNGMGEVLLTLGSLGFFLFAFNKNTSLKHKLLLISFPVFYYLVIGRSALGFQRYALPLVPFWCFFAAYFLFQFWDKTRELLPNFVRLRGIQTVFLVVLLGASIYQPIFVSTSIIHTMVQEDTRNTLRRLALKISEKESNPNLNAFPCSRSSKASFAKTLGVSCISFSSEMKDDPELLILDNLSPELLIVDSLTVDRYIYDGEKKFPVKLLNQIKKMDGVIIISPFRKDKSKVPFSPKSSYAPYPPDLEFRNKPGPYFEIYFEEGKFSDTLVESCYELSTDCEVSDAKKGYYQNHLKS